MSKESAKKEKNLKQKDIASNCLRFLFMYTIVSVQSQLLDAHRQERIFFTVSLAVSQLRFRSKTGTARGDNILLVHLCVNLNRVLCYRFAESCTL